MGKCNIYIKQKFGMLTVESRNYNKTNSNGDIYWNCSCECGGKRVTTTRSLNSGSCISCGCIQKLSVKNFHKRQKELKDYKTYPRTPIITPPLNELWKTILDFPNYEISNLGQIRNVNSHHILSPQGKSLGRYLSVTLYNNSFTSGITVYIHRLVAEYFLPKPYDKTLILNHKDTNIYHNWSTNLEWVSLNINNNWSDRNAKISQTMRTSIKAINQRNTAFLDKRAKPVFQYDFQSGNYITQFSSVGQAKKSFENNGNGVNEDQIRNCCLGKRTEYKGYLWSYTRKENFYE